MTASPQGQIWVIKMDMSDCPRILREFLTYHETIKGQSRRTISEYYLDLRMFFRFLIVFRDDRLPYDYDLNQVSIQDVDLNFVSRITPTEIYEFFVYLGNDRVYHTETQHPGKGVENAARARKLSAIKSFFKYLTVSTKQLEENPAADIEFPKLRRALPKYLTLDEAQELLSNVKGRNAERDFAILMVFLNCGLRISELAGLNYGDIHNDRLRVWAKETKNAQFTWEKPARKPLQRIMPRSPLPFRRMCAVPCSYPRKRQKTGLPPTVACPPTQFIGW